MRQKWETNLLEMFLEKKCSISCSTCYGNTLQNPLYLQSTIYIPWPPPHHWNIRWETCHFKKHSRLIQKMGRGGKFWRFLKAVSRFPDIWIQGTLHRQVALISYNNRPMHVESMLMLSKLVSTTRPLQWEQQKSKFPYLLQDNECHHHWPTSPFQEIQHRWRQHRGKSLQHILKICLPIQI